MHAGGDVVEGAVGVGGGQSETIAQRSGEGEIEVEPDGLQRVFDGCQREQRLDDGEGDDGGSTGHRAPLPERRAHESTVATLGGSRRVMDRSVGWP